MDPVQLKELITAIQIGNEKLLCAITSQQNGELSVQNQAPPALLSTFESFDNQKESFTQYLERFKNYIHVKRLKEDDDLVAPLFLNSIGASTYSLLSTIVAPRSVLDLTFKEISESLSKQLNPKKNILVERHRFLLCTQDSGQTLSDYIATLRGFIRTCEFKCTCNKSLSDIFLTSQFVRGIKDNSIREQLLMSPDLTFDQVTEKALALEASKIDSQNISNPVPQAVTSGSEDVHRISKPAMKTQKYQQESQKHIRKRYNGHVDLKELGLHDLCLRCGRNNHTSDTCRIDSKNLKCASCKRTGHIKKVCIKSLLQEKNRVKQINEDSDNYDYEYDFSHLNKVIEIYSSENKSNARKYFIDVIIGNKCQKFEVDSGAGLTLLPKKDFDNLQVNYKIKPTSVKFRSYTSGIFKPVGVVDVPVTCNGRTSRQQIYIVPDQFTPLLGRSWIRAFGIELSQIDNCQEYNCFSVNFTDPDKIVTEIKKKYSDLFKSEIGCIPHMTCSLQLRENSKPVFVKERPVPYALREKVEKELDELERTGIITKVNWSDWGSPLVVLPKPDGNVRLCVDYKNTINPQLKDSHYPIPRIEEVLHELRDAEYFCTLDLYKAYLHVQVDEDSAILQTISTHRGTYKVNRLSFGVKTAPSDFHRILSQILTGLTGVATYFDDLTVYGSTFEDCYKKLVALLDRLREYNIHVNQKKCQFFKKSISLLGYIVQKNSILKCPKKVEAIVNLPRPKDKEELHRFLGMVTHYSKFVPNMSTLTNPLRILLKKNCKFIWNESCECAFNKLKHEISSNRVLVPYNPSLPVTVTCDASPTGIAGVLSHIIGGSERPVAFVSRSLTSAEQNYSQLDREALAIVFTISKFFNYLYGRPFTLISDNRPLTRIFNHDAKLPQMTSARLLRYAVFLQDFNYKIEHRKADQLRHVDCLSRSPSQATTRTPDMMINREVRDISEQTINQITSGHLTFRTLSEETLKDKNLGRLLSDLRSGQNTNPEYSIQGNILFRGTRVVVPKSLQQDVLEELHKTHIGIVKMKQLARQYCWWDSVDKDIEHLVKSCPDCALVRKSPAKAPMHHWDEPEDNFQRVHIDYAGPVEGQYFLVLVDAKSKWPEVRITKSAPTSEGSISILTDIFSFHGLPQVIVSDNATVFTSECFKEFCLSNGITQKFIAPGHPATNGLAERHIQTLKYKLTSMRSSGKPLKTRMQEILFRYRATPQSDNLSPGEKYLGRKIRIKLDALFPPKPERKGKLNKIFKQVRNLSVGDRVQAKWYSAPNRESWKFGVIVEKLGKLHYIVRLDTGYQLKRHINQLIRSQVRLSPSRTNIDQKPSADHLLRDISVEPKQQCPPPSPVTPSQEPGQHQILHRPPPSPESNAPQEPGTRNLILPSPENNPQGEFQNLDEPGIYQEEPPAPNVTLRKSQRIRRPPIWLQDYNSA